VSHGAAAPLRLALLISGSGRTALNLAERIERDRIDAEIGVVIAHRTDLPGALHGAAAGLPVQIVPSAPAETLDDRIDAALAEADAELVCLCGYLRRFRVGERWRNRTINIHPSLLPEFGGAGWHGRRVHEAVIAAGRRESGCTVHLVTEGYDEGPILLQRRCPVLPGDTPETLAARVFEEEREALPAAVRAWAAGRSATGRGGLPAGVWEGRQEDLRGGLPGEPRGELPRIAPCPAPVDAPRSER
jgi:folate-dependent phosphoribosylglycinamide formyltransferase PurN